MKSAWNGKLSDCFTSSDEGVLISMVLKGAGKCLKQDYILLFKFIVEIKLNVQTK